MFQNFIVLLKNIHGHCWMWQLAIKWINSRHDLHNRILCWITRGIVLPVLTSILKLLLINICVDNIVLDLQKQGLGRYE
jgi:hypothetical protein